jgi:threonine synthase
MYLCIRCNAVYPEIETPYLCPRCGGLYDWVPQPYQTPDPDSQALPGIWRYRNNFGFAAPTPIVSLGEGNTPLIWADAFGYRVAFKCEYQNPTCSFKDRGSATLAGFLSARGVSQIVEDSSGNAGASIAAYAARAGFHAQIYVPETASGPKRKQIEAYGAEVVAVPGQRSNAAEQARKATRYGLVYASHAYLPFNLPGYATIAFEILDQLGESPGTLICPAGQGGLLLGAAQGFLALISAGKINRCPKLIGVQARACAPLVERFQYPSGSQRVTEVDTMAEGVRVRNPLRAEKVIQVVRSSEGDFLAVPEDEILSGRDELAFRGFYVETTSAIVWNALDQAIHSAGAQRLPEPVVVVLTGSGLKTA